MLYKWESMHRFQPEPIEPLLNALAHPVRTQVLAALSDRQASAAEIAEIIGQPAGKVRYHLRALAKSGLIGWEEAEDRRGVREYYWAVRTRQMIEDEQYQELTTEQIRLMTLFAMRLMFTDATIALRDGAFVRRNDHCMIRFRLPVDERGWKELVEVYRSAMARIERVRERAAGRISKQDEDPVTVSASLMLFDLKDPPKGALSVAITEQ